MDELFDKLNDVIDRERYLCNINEILDLWLVNIIFWPRRVGKSYFLYSVINYLLKQWIINENQIFYVNKEWYNFGNIKTYEDLNRLFDESKINSKDIFFVWLDEVQEIKWFEKFVLNIFSKYKNAKIFITWSNSKLLSSNY